MYVLLQVGLSKGNKRKRNHNKTILSDFLMYYKYHVSSKFPCRNSTQISIIVLDILFEFNHCFEQNKHQLSVCTGLTTFCYWSYVPIVFFFKFNYNIITWYHWQLEIQHIELCITFCYIHVIQIYILHFLLNYILSFINMFLGGLIFE